MKLYKTWTKAELREEWHKHMVLAMLHFVIGGGKDSVSKGGVLPELKTRVWKERKTEGKKKKKQSKKADDKCVWKGEWRFIFAVDTTHKQRHTNNCTSNGVLISP